MTRWDFDDGSWLEEYPPETREAGLAGYRWTSYGWQGCQAYGFQARRSRDISAAVSELTVPPGRP